MSCVVSKGSLSPNSAHSSDMWLSVESDKLTESLVSVDDGNHTII